MGARAWPSTPGRDAVRLVLWVTRGPADPLCSMAYAEACRRGGSTVQQLLGAAFVARVNADARRTPDALSGYAEALRALATALAGAA